MDDILDVKMLGGFTISRGKNSIDDSANRMKKVWLLLAYTIYSRSRRISQENYLSVLSGTDPDEGVDPGGKLKAMFYRVRTMLSCLGSEAGHELIIHKGGSYSWNPEIPVRLDVEEFDSLIARASAAEDEEQALELYMQALELYKGDFLPKLAMDPWVMPISAYYHRVYVETVERVLCMLESRECWAETENLCRRALAIEPYREEIYQSLMRSLISADSRGEAMKVYENMSELLFSNFGVMPSDESRELYRLASREAETGSVPMGTVRERLKEQNASKGALFCEYDFFRLLYQVQARSIIRSGETIHIGLFSIHGRYGKELSRRSLDTAMNNFRKIVMQNLRQGDIVTKCSVSQFIVMLPQANYENSCMVCQRVVRAFFAKHPHSPADINYSVQPLEPLESVGEVTAGK